MVKKGGIRFDENEQVFMPIFGEQEIDVPEYLAEKTKKGYKLVPTLTKSGNITKRHKEPSIKIVAKNIEHITIPNNKVERLSLNEFIKKSKLELEKQYADFIKLQQKIVDAEMTEILKMPEVHAAIMESDDKAAAVEEIREVVESEIMGMKEQHLNKIYQEEALEALSSKSGKKKKLTFDQLETKINNIKYKMEDIVEKEKPLMLERATKLFKDDELPRIRFQYLKDFVKTKSDKRFDNAVRPTPENRYVFEPEGIISKSAANKYYELNSQRDALQAEFDRRKEENKNKRKK
jgi:hypothetical protein